MTKPIDTTKLSTRGNRRIDYTSTAVMSERQRQKQQQRQLAREGVYVIGEFRSTKGAIVLFAIPLQPGWWIDRSADLTPDLLKMNRWRTRQAARQWMILNQRTRCRIVNLDQLVHGRRVVASTIGPARHATQERTKKWNINVPTHFVSAAQ